MSDPPTQAQLMIRPARELSGISMRELARRIGVSVGTMSGIETGKTTVSVERLTTIAAELGTTVESLAEIVSPTRVDDAVPAFDWRVFPDRDLDPALAAAIRCFVGVGYHGATMRTIAAEAGLSAAGVYHHYPSKQSLLTAVFDLAHAELAAHTDAAAADADSPTMSFGNVCEAVALFAATRRDVMLIVLADQANVDPSDKARVQSASDRLVRNVERLVDEIGVDDPSATARAVVDLCGSVCRLDPTADPTTVARLYRQFGLRLAGE
ncbi:TetR family transcriptional regulator [Gordonia malaquae]|uniref:Putative TetR family transcriptional regulator n=1 Tax=Gordonia malaquae NBRC 108250 TaxID=1223542 RepID=M3VDT7_GORML|nr:TetR family transcriptional regulator [Gordonia malaquae]GAC78709.1 putative TetR family transcriptional regulator [Gordonia malaquae NBRC 108250]